MNEAELTLPAGFRLHRYETLGSTSDEARTLARAGAHGVHASYEAAA